MAMIIWLVVVVMAAGLAIPVWTFWWIAAELVSPSVARPAGRGTR